MSEDAAASFDGSRVIGAKLAESILKRSRFGKIAKTFMRSPKCIGSMKHFCNQRCVLFNMMKRRKMAMTGSLTGCSRRYGIEVRWRSSAEWEAWDKQLNMTLFMESLAGRNDTYMFSNNAAFSSP
jgi:hypothetical protein